MDDSDDVFIDKEMKLIEQVRLSPMLYDPSNLAFRLTHRKEHEWRLIARHVGLTADETKKRWCTIRDRFTRQLKQTRLHPDRPEIGASPFFHAMSFLKKFVKERRPRFPEYNNRKRREGWTSVTRPKTEKTSFNEDSLSNMKDSIHDDSDDDFDFAFENSKQINNDDTQYAEFVEVPEENYSYNEQEVTSLPKIERNEAMKSEVFENSDEDSIDDGVEEHETSPPPEKYQPMRKRSREMRSSKSLRDTPLTDSSEDDPFSKTITAYLRQLTRQHKIKAQVEIFQILEKFIDIEESEKNRRRR